MRASFWGNSRPSNWLYVVNNSSNWTQVPEVTWQKIRCHGRRSSNPLLLFSATADRREPRYELQSPQSLPFEQSEDSDSLLTNRTDPLLSSGNPDEHSHSERGSDRFVSTNFRAICAVPASTQQPSSPRPPSPDRSDPTSPSRSRYSQHLPAASPLRVPRARMSGCFGCRLLLRRSRVL